MTQPSRIDGLPDLPKLSMDDMRNLVRDSGLDWHKGWVFDGEPNRFAQLISATWHRACYEAGSAAAAQAAKQVPASWQPIETAPKDGRQLILSGVGAMGTSWVLQGWHDHEKDGWWESNTHWTDSPGDGQLYPNVWQPMPEAPSATSLASAAEAGQVEAAAWKDVRAERLRQINAEGWTPKHDDEHDDGGMAQAAACYASHASVGPELRKRDLPRDWPWAPKWWKPGDQRRMLVKAGALILAEIERLDRINGDTQ